MRYNYEVLKFRTLQKISYVCKFRLFCLKHFTLVDTSAEQDGKITGGYSEKGGGIYAEDANLYINGGKITGNTTSSNGGGIYMNDGYLYIYDAVITGNTAQDGGGVYWASSNNFSLTGGTITNNTASKNGGGVYATNYGEIYIGGTAVVKDNSSNNYYLSAKEVDLNLAKSQSNDIPDAPLTDGAYIGITANANDLISGGHGRFDAGSAAYLHADDESFYIRSVYDKDGGENKYKSYYTEKTNTSVEAPSIDSITILDNEILKDASVDNKTKTITIKVSGRASDSVEGVTLDSLISVTPGSSVTSMEGGDSVLSFDETVQFKVTASDGTYVIYTVKLEREEATTSSITVSFAREDGVSPIGYAKLYIYKDSTKSELVDTIVLEDESTETSDITVDVSLYDGKYYIELVKNGYLPLKKEITVSNGAFSVGEIKVIPGDIKGSFDDECGDGVIDIDDFARVLRGFAKSATSEIKEAIDINEDGSVNVSDLGYIKANFGKTSNDVK